MRAPRRPQGAGGLDAVDVLAERAMGSGRRIGLVVGCLAGGEQRVVGYGRLRRDAQDPPDGGTVFEIGSITKVFTGLLLADLAEQGLVGLDDPLASYLPASVRVPTGGGRQITLGDLASHAGGPPPGPPGAAGQPYEALVRERICLPLGMPDTVVTLTGEQTARLATGYTRRGRPAPRLVLPALVGAGALRSTATNLLGFLAANLEPARTPLAAQIERTQRPRLRAARRVEVGLGWLIAHPPGAAGPVLWHNGGTSGVCSFVALPPGTPTALVVVRNTPPSLDRPG